MKISWQPIIFFVFVLAFLITAPLVVLHTAGYRYQLHGNKILKTGVLSISSFPRGATLLIDDHEESMRTPAVIENVLPGIHTISLKKEGYLPWNKSLEVSSGSTTFAENVVLFFDEPSTFVGSQSVPIEKTEHTLTETLFDNRRVKINPLPDRTVLAFVDDVGISNIIAYLPAGTYTFQDAPKNVLLLVDREHARFIVVDPNDEQPILLNVTGTQFAWNTQRPELLFSDGFDVQTYNTSSHTKETLTRLSDPIIDLAWFPRGEVILYATTTHINALELDRRGLQNYFDLATLDHIDSFTLDEKGEVLTIIGTRNADTGAFQKHLQK